MKLKSKSWFKPVCVILVFAMAAVICLVAYYYAEVHKNKLCKILDNLTLEQIETISVGSPNGELALLKNEEEMNEVLSLITQIDAYGRGTEKWRDLNGGLVPNAFYIEMKDGTSFYVGSYGIVDYLGYKVHSDWKLDKEITKLYWTLYNKYTVPYMSVQQKVRLELVQGTWNDTGADFIVYNDSYYDIYLDGEFSIQAINSSVKPYVVDIENAQCIKARSQYEITLDWSEVGKEVLDEKCKIVLYYITERAGFGAYVVCDEL